MDARRFGAVASAMPARFTTCFTGYTADNCDLPAEDVQSHPGKNRASLYGQSIVLRIRLANSVLRQLECQVFFVPWQLLRYGLLGSGGVKESLTKSD
jgi:hypothetical protein